MHGRGADVPGMGTERQRAACCAQISAGDHSIAAGGNVHIDQIDVQWTDALVQHLAKCASTPGAIECRHCHLRGLSPDADRCPACRHDIGATRRYREQERARRARIRRMIADARHIACYGVALAVTALIFEWCGHAGNSSIAMTFTALLFVVAIGEALVQLSIDVQLWCQFTLPEKLRQFFGANGG